MTSNHQHELVRKTVAVLESFDKIITHVHYIQYSSPIRPQDHFWEVLKSYKKSKNP